MIEFYISHRNPKKQIKEAVPGNMIFRDFFKKKSRYEVQNQVGRHELFFINRNRNILKSAQIERRTPENEKNDETIYTD